MENFNEEDLILTTVAIDMCYFSLQLLLKEKERKRKFFMRAVNINRCLDGYFTSVFKKIQETDQEEFFKLTRMTLPVFHLLLDLLKSKLTMRRTKYTISAEARLSITLSYLSQGVSHQFLAWSYKIGKTTARNIIIDTCTVIWEELSPLYVAQPNAEDYKVIAKDFENFWDLPNCVGAIDGKHIAIQCPAKSGSLFYNYKSHFSIVLLAACDARYIFTMADVGAYGSESDGGILANSEFGKQLLEQKLPLPIEKLLPRSNMKCPFFFVGDPAFPLKKNIMRAYPGKCLPLDKKICNYRFSRARVVIENAFGILVARWRVLRAPINAEPENVSKIVLATIALHNFIKLNQLSAHVYCPRTFIDHEDSEGNSLPGQWRQEVGSHILPRLDARKLGSNNSTKIAFQLRNDLKDYFVNEGAIERQKKIF